MALFLDGPGDSDQSLVFESEAWITKGAEETYDRDGGAGLQRRGGRRNQDEALRGVQLRRDRGVRQTDEEQPVSPRSRSLPRVPEYLELQTDPAQTGPDRANPKGNLSTVRAERGLP